MSDEMDKAFAEVDDVIAAPVEPAVPGIHQASVVPGMIFGLPVGEEAAAYREWRQACIAFQRAFAAYKVAERAEIEARAKLGNLIAPPQ